MTQNRLTTRRHARDNLYRVWLLSQNSRFALRIHPARKSEQSLGQVDKTPGILRLAPQLARGEYPLIGQSRQYPLLQFLAGQSRREGGRMERASERFNVD
jgi:hypothetical protein